jgi:hypothetical protein
MRGIAVGINVLLALWVLFGWALELRGESLSLRPDLPLRAAYTFQVAVSIWALLRPATRSIRVLALCANAALLLLNLWLLCWFGIGGEPAPSLALGLLLAMGLLPAAVNLVTLGRIGGRSWRRRAAT